MAERLNRIIRSINAAISFTTFGIGALSLAGIVLPLLVLLSWNEDRRRLLFCKSIRISWIFFVKIMEFLNLIKVNISTKDKKLLNTIEGTIIATNHPSLIDIVIMVSLVNKPICIAKGKLTKNFFMKYIILHAYIHNAQDPEKLLSESKEVLDKGFNLIIFPEGTRTMPGQISKLQRGTAYISIDSGHDILTAHIKNSDNILGKYQKWYDVGDKTVTYDICIKEIINPAELCNKNDSHNINARKLTEVIKNNIEK